MVLIAKVQIRGAETRMQTDASMGSMTLSSHPLPLLLIHTRNHHAAGQHCMSPSLALSHPMP